VARRIYGNEAAIPYSEQAQALLEPGHRSFSLE
jgi:hypothetical protein